MKRQVGCMNSMAWSAGFAAPAVTQDVPCRIGSRVHTWLSMQANWWKLLKDWKGIFFYSHGSIERAFCGVAGECFLPQERRSGVPACGALGCNLLLKPLCCCFSVSQSNSKERKFPILKVSCFHSLCNKFSLFSFPFQKPILKMHPLFTWPAFTCFSSGVNLTCFSKIKSSSSSTFDSKLRITQAIKHNTCCMLWRGGGGDEQIDAACLALGAACSVPMSRCCHSCMAVLCITGSLCCASWRVLWLPRV